MVWNNVKFYVLAFAIVLAGSVISTALQLLENLFPEIHPLNKLAANLSGVTFGGVFMVLAFLRDNRLDEERRRAENAQLEAADAQNQAKSAQKEAKSALELAQSALQEAEAQRQEAEAQHQRAEVERQRADRAEAELQRVRDQYHTDDLVARIRRLEELYGIDTGDADNRTMDQ